MMPSSSRFARSLKSTLVRGHHVKALFALLMATAIVPAAHAATATTTTLAVSANSVPYKTPVILTATVTAGGSPVTAGIVLFCDATAAYCENNSALGSVQLTSPNATAVVKIGSGGLGSHSYKAVFRQNHTYATSTSNTVTYSVTGTYSSSTTITETGTVGNYTLTGTVVGVGSLNAGPSGNLSFLDTSTGNSVLGTEPLGPAVLSDVFVQSPPFAIGGTGATQRSVAIASAYLNSDNNLDLVTGDAEQTVTVLLGNGDGTFKPKVTYPGCPTGVAEKVLLADFNRDGNTDIALGCSNGSSGGLVILLGNGDGSFKPPVQYASGDVSGIAIGDFNGDGILDVAATDHLQQNVTIFLGVGDGTFQAGTKVIATPSPANDIVVADFNGNGNDDLAYAINTADTTSSLSDLYFASGNGDGTFQTPILVASKIGEFLTTGDVNADDKPDIVSSSDTAPGGTRVGLSLWVIIGNGDGTFKTPVSYLSDIPSDPHLADVNGDGNPDIIAGGSTGALVYLGNGDGTFQAYQEPSIGGFALTYAVNSGDYNNDGDADLAGTDAGSPRAAVSLSEVRQTATANALTGVAVFPLGSGTHNVDASFPGNTFYAASLSSTVPLVAAPTPTTLTLVVAPSSGTLAGQSVTLTATLSPYTVGPPNTTTNGEKVSFYTGTTLIGTGVLSNGVASVTTTTLPAGADSLTAVYAGDSNYKGSSSNTQTVTVTGVLLTSSLNPSSYSQSVTITATVLAGATGTVTFKNGKTTLGTSPIVGGIATFTTTTFPVGEDDITGFYNGDTSHPSSSSPILAQIVNMGTPVVTVTTSGPSTYGNSVTITASVPSGPQGPTGTITISSGGVTLGSGTVGSSGVVTVTTSTLPTGSDPITATYSGDTNYNSTTGSTTQQVSKITPSSTLTSSLNPSTPGASVTFTDTLPTGATGSVTFTNGATVIGTSTVTNGVATVTTSSLPTGSDVITATYTGAVNYAGVTATLTQVVAAPKTTPTVTVTTSGPSTYGNPVTITAGVPSGATGTITITSGGTTLGSGTVSAGGTVTVTTSTLPVGTDPITATYSGDTKYNTATGTGSQTVSKASPTSTLTSSANPSTQGNSVTFTDTLPTAATGTVTFTSGATVLGTSPVAGGVATVSTSTLPTGSDPITATYNGDTNNGTSVATLTQTVNAPKTTPTVTVTTSGPSTYGNPVTITAGVPSGATGTITITSGGTTLGSGTVSAGGTVTVTTSTLPVGTDPLTATYSGDTSYNTATGTGSQTVSKASPTSTLTSSANPSMQGNSVTFTDTLPTTVTGTVTFTSGATVLGTSPVAGGVATVATSSLPVGSDPITATYNGDANDNTSTATLTQTVNAKTTPTVTVTTSGPSIVGSPVTITVTVPTGATGTVTVTSGGTTLGTGTVSSTGTVTVTTSTLPVGTDPITATYSGDSNNNPATGTANQTVSKASPASTLTSSANPSTAGNPVTFTDTLPTTVTGTVTFTSGTTVLGTSPVTGGVATVTTSSLPAGSDPITATYSGDSNNNTSTATLTQTVGKGTPTVTVTTSGPSTVGNPVTITVTVPTGATGTVTVTSGGTTLGTGTVSSTGTVTVTTSTLPVGTDPITATYSGDSNNNPGTGTASQIVAKQGPTVGLTSSANPSNLNQSVTFTATVPSGATGTVTFLDGSTTIGSGTVGSSGVATFTTSTLTAGVHTITASYGGDTNNASGISAPLAQTVNKSTPTLPPPGVSTTTPTAGSPVTITETVPPGVSGPVTFSNGGTTIGTAPVVGGVATITVSNLPIGTDPITASTPGDANNNPATSPATTVTVGKPSSITLTSSANPSPVSQPVTFTATLASGATGTVTFSDGSTVLGTGTVTGGLATYTTSTLTAGSHTITASYGGDANNGAATSAPLIETIGKATPTLPPPGVSTSSPAAGAPVTITETVPTGVSGPVTFSNGGTTIGTAPVVGGVATITVSNLPLGTDSITASTPGDANNNPATSPATTVTVGKTNSTVTLTSSANPSAASVPITFTASVTAGATGTMTFLDGSTILGTGTVSAAGLATFTTSTLTIGSHPITATYSGDTNYGVGTSAVLVQVISKIPTTITLTESTPAQLSNGAVTFTATVAAPSPTPTGTVTFLDGTTVLGTSALSTNGTVVVSLSNTGNAALSISTLSAGLHQITAVYSGDNTFATSTSAPASDTVEDFTNVNTGKASQNVFPGAVTTYTFTLTPTSAATFLNEANLAVSGLPDGSTYTFSPATVAAGSGATAVTLSVQTSSSLRAMNKTPQNDPSSQRGLPIALGMLGLAGLGSLRKLRQKMPRSLLLLLLAIGSLLPIAALSGCAGGYFTLNPTTYTVTVTGTEGSVQHSATATLIVQ